MELQTQNVELEYVGFWARTGASIIDTLLLVALVVPLVGFVFGISSGTSKSVTTTTTNWAGQYSMDSGSWFFQIVGALLVIGFWLWRQATPGKMVIASRVVDAKSGLPMSYKQAVGRYLAYFVSAIPLCIGFIWVAFDAKKQGWHDKLAGTVVVRSKAAKPLTQAEPVTFN